MSLIDLPAFYLNHSPIKPQAGRKLGITVEAFTIDVLTAACVGEIYVLFYKVSVNGDSDVALIYSDFTFATRQSIT